MTRRVSFLIALLVPLTLLVVRPAMASDESDFVSRTNSARSSNGLAAYATRYDLADVARRQAGRMAAAHQIFHNANLGSEVGNWRALAENVGKGSTVSAIQSAFMGSSSHRANILSSLYTEVGVGTARGSDGMLYVSEVFRRPNTVSSYTPPPTRTRTVYPRSVRRASRSAPRRAPVIVQPPKRPATVVNRTPGRLRAAWRLLHRESPAGSIDHAVTFIRATRVLTS